MGDFLGTQGIARDISARKQAEEALRQSERQAAVVAERLPLPEITIVGLVARGGLLGIAYVIVWVLLLGGVRRGREILGAARHLLPGSGGAGGASDDRESERRATP